MNGVLIIDDEEGVRRALHKALGKEDYQIFLATDGQAAIDLVKERPGEIAIVISDYKMPGIDGLQTLVAIGGLNPEITRIMLTGYATLESAIAATNEGLDGFLTKPFDNLELRAKVREYFVRKRLKQFVSPQVLRELQEHPAQLVPRKCTASILFVDIRGFTALTARHDPEPWSAFLSLNYFSPMSEIIFRNAGTLDKHIGDCIMAIYGAPQSAEDDARRAVRSAIEMRDQMRALNAAADEAHQLPIGIGIHTGRSGRGHVRFGAQTRVHGAGPDRQPGKSPGEVGRPRSNSHHPGDAGSGWSRSRSRAVAQRHGSRRNRKCAAVQRTESE